MPRTLDDDLEAQQVVITAGPTVTFVEPNAQAYIKAYVSPAELPFDVLYYRYDGINLTAKLSGLIDPDWGTPTIRLRRGFVINDTLHYVDSSELYIISVTEEDEYPTGIHTVNASLLPAAKISVNGAQSYRNVITDAMAQIGFTAAFKDPTADFWDYQFYPAGKTLLVSSAKRFLNLLNQKYFIGATDNGSGEILFFCIAGWITRDYTAVFSSSDIVKTKYNNTLRTFIYTDELGAVHKWEEGDLEAGRYAPVHNLGYLESTAKTPSTLRDSGPTLNICVTKPRGFFASTGINLYIQSGDRIAKSSLSIGCVLVTEILDTKKSPSWYVEISNYDPIQNTEGGALPSSIADTANYIPVNTSEF